jgi:hypothetical protein
MDDMRTTMRRRRRTMLGIALLGATGPLLAAPRLRVAATRLDAELAAIAREQGTVFIAGALPGTHPDRTVSGRHSGADAQQWCAK